MGFKQRERKRRRKGAQSRNRERSRSSGSSAGKWWLTPLVRTQACAKCGTLVREGRDAVYRHRPVEVCCPPCADREKLPYRPSVRWERQRRKGGRAT